MTTPTTPAGLTQYDHLPAAEAVLAAWTDPGSHPDYHRSMQRQVRLGMPVMARALDRLAAERGRGSRKRADPAPG